MSESERTERELGPPPWRESDRQARRRETRKEEEEGENERGSEGEGGRIEKGYGIAKASAPKRI
jgi:hypothetical protein